MSNLLHHSTLRIPATFGYLPARFMAREQVREELETPMQARHDTLLVAEWHLILHAFCGDWVMFIL